MQKATGMERGQFPGRPVKINCYDSCCCCCFRKFSSILDWESSLIISFQGSNLAEILKFPLNLKQKEIFQKSRKRSSFRTSSSMEWHLVVQEHDDKLFFSPFMSFTPIKSTLHTRPTAFKKVTIQNWCAIEFLHFVRGCTVFDNHRKSIIQLSKASYIYKF